MNTGLSDSNPEFHIHILLFIFFNSHCTYKYQDGYENRHLPTSKSISVTQKKTTTTIEMAPASPEKRKWSARAWWLGLHVYVYAVLAHSGSLSVRALSPSGFALVLAVALVNAVCYVRLQRSTPGFVEREPHDLEAGHLGTGTEDSELASDSDSLVPTKSRDHERSAVSLHYCELCQLTQPLRTKHWYGVSVMRCITLSCILRTHACLWRSPSQQGLWQVRAPVRPPVRLSAP